MRMHVISIGSGSGTRFRRARITGVCLAVLAPLALPAQNRPSLPSGRELPPVLEGERLVAVARASAGRVAVQDMTGFGEGWSGGAQLFWTGGAAGAVLDLTFSIPQPAEYALDASFTRAPDYARVSVDIDGESGAAFDGYGTGVSPPAVLHAGRFFLSAGTHTLRIRIDGKHPQSSGYLVGLDRIALHPGPAAGASALRVTRETAAQPGQPPPRTAVRGDTSARAVLEVRRNAGEADAGAPASGCTASCLGSVSTVYGRHADGQCRAWFRIPCDPYGCEKSSGLCRQNCSSSSDCADGSQCNTSTGMCVAMPYACTDSVTVKSANGQTESCKPYKCAAGACRETCESSNDCAQGYVCNAYARCAKK